MTCTSFKKRVFNAIEVGYDEDFIGRAYDIVNLGFIVVNLIVSLFVTFDDIMKTYGDILIIAEAVTVFFFTFDWLLRLWTSNFLYPGDSRLMALLRYSFSFNGLVDMLSCVPYYMPFFFPTGVAAFRIFRVVRIFRIFRVNAYFDSLNVIAAVIKSKARLLLSSVFVVLMLMVASSLCMYSVEHTAQPEVFDNALSGMWWAAATLLTVGYGDIYPITPMGQILGIIITMLGVGIVAIPTGIISAGFVEQYSRMKQLSEEAAERNIHFIKIPIGEKDSWKGMMIKELAIPREMIIAAVIRKKEMIVPRGDVCLKAGDVVVLGAESYADDMHIALKEIELKEKHEWNGKMIKDLDISRQTFIVMIRRNGKTIIPRGDLVLRAGDDIVLYTRQHLADAKSLMV